MKKYLVMFLGCLFAGAIGFSLYVLFSVVNLRETLTDNLDRKHPADWISATAITRDFRSALLASFDASFDECKPGAYWRSEFHIGSHEDAVVCRLPQILSRELTSGGLDAVLIGGLISARLPQDSILAEILNRIYFGHPCGKPFTGVVAASRFYFNKIVTDLSFAEMAELFAIAREPELADDEPGSAPARAERDSVVQLFVDAKLIDASDAAKIISTPVVYANACRK